MTIRNSLLALLAGQSTHGYDLKASFEESTAGAWPLNVGQVYTTLNRLERDGFVKLGGSGEGKRQTWKITRAGRSALDGWYEAPVLEDPPPRDELAIKVLLAVAAEDVDVSAILQRQRMASMDQLQRYTRHKQQADPEEELPWLLLLDALILKTEAEIKWLDLCEARLQARGK